ncbi:MAG: hypothetical protein QOE92_2437 [Chloroflexota bacterium]|nr:hypothetical protein [Chloroflexota bacterium]
MRGFYLDPRLLALPGIEQARGFTRGQLLPPPIHYLTGLTFEGVEPGTARFTMPATRWLLSPQGVVSGATLALLADGPLGSAVQTGLPAARPFTTSEISMTYLRPAAADGRDLVGEGRLIHAGRSIALAEATITDSDGNVVALTSTRCVVLPKVELPPGLDEAARALPELTEPGWPSAHPFQREAEGGVIPQEDFDRLSGLEIMRGCASGELPTPPISRLLGHWPEEVEEGRVSWSMPASEWMCSPVQGRLYGGVIAYFAGNAIDGAFATLTPAGAAIAPLDLKVYFLRPVAPDGRLLTALGEVQHRGRTMMVGRGEVRDEDGKVVALATASAMILPGRPASVARAVERGELGEPG